MEKTTEEKIDYIYNHIKLERKFIYGKIIFKTLMYLFFIAYLIYFYMYGFEKFTNKVIESIKPNINSEEVVDEIKEKFKNIKNSLYKNKEEEKLDNY